MAKNYVQPGEVLTLAAPYARSSGEGMLVGSLFAVALGDAANGADVSAAITGVFDLACAASQTWAVGDRLFWDNTAKAVTNVRAENKPIGICVKARASGDTTGRVRLDGVDAGKVLFNAAALNFGSIGAGLAAELTITVTGAVAGDGVALAPPAAIEAGLVAMGYVSAADTVTVRLENATAGSVDPASATWGAFVLKK